LLSVTESSVKDPYGIHRVSQPLVTHAASLTVQFIFILLLIIVPYTRPTLLRLGEAWISANCRFF
jgi:hypothetical protein